MTAASTVRIIVAMMCWACWDRKSCSLTIILYWRPSCYFCEMDALDCLRIGGIGWLVEAVSREIQEGLIEIASEKDLMADGIKPSYFRLTPEYR